MSWQIAGAMLLTIRIDSSWESDSNQYQLDGYISLVNIMPSYSLRPYWQQTFSLTKLAIIGVNNVVVAVLLVTSVSNPITNVTMRQINQSSMPFRKLSSSPNHADKPDVWKLQNLTFYHRKNADFITDINNSFHCFLLTSCHLHWKVVQNENLITA